MRGGGVLQGQSASAECHPSIRNLRDDADERIDRMLAIAIASTGFTLNSVSSYHAATAARPHQPRIAQPPTMLCYCNRRYALPLIAGSLAYILPKAASADEVQMKSEFGYIDNAGRKSYSQVQRAWEQSADMTQRERMLALRGAGKPDLANGEVESPKKQKRRAMAGCQDKMIREQAGYKVESDCNARVMSGDVQFMLDVMDAS